MYGGRLQTAGLGANICEAQEELLALLLFGSILSITTLIGKMAQAKPAPYISIQVATKASAIPPLFF